MNPEQTIEITKGNLRTAVGALLTQGGEPVDLAGKTVTFFMVDEHGEDVVSESSTGVTVHPTQAFTVGALDRIVCNGHRVQKGQQIVVSNTGGALPPGLTAATRYFAIEVTPNFFKVSLVPNGPAVDITGAGTGTHSFYVVGSVQKTFLADDVSAAGDFFCWFNVTENGEKDTFPVDGRQLRVRILEAI